MRMFNDICGYDDNFMKISMILILTLNYTNLCVKMRKKRVNLMCEGF